MSTHRYTISPFAVLEKQAAAAAVGDGFRQGATMVGDGFRQGATMVGDGFRQGAIMVGDGMRQGAQTGVLNAARTDLGDMATGARQAAGGAGNVVGGALRTLWNGATAPIHAAGAGVAGAVKGAWNARGQGAGGMFAGANAGAAAGAQNAIKTDLGDMASGFGQAAKGMGNAVGGVGRTVWNAVTAPVHAAGAGMAGAAQGGWNATFPKSAALSKSAFAPLAGGMRMGGSAGAGGNGLWGPGGSDALANAGAHGRQVTQFTGPQGGSAPAGGIAGAMQGVGQGLQLGQQGAQNFRDGVSNTVQGAGKAWGNVTSSPALKLAQGVGGAFKGAWQNRQDGIGGMVDGARGGAVDGVLGGFRSGLNQMGLGASQATQGLGQSLASPFAAISGGIQGGLGMLPKSAFASLEKLAFQPPAPLLANAGGAGRFGDGSQRANVNKWIGQAGPQLPDRPGTHQRALAPAAKPSRIGDMPVLGSDTAAGKGMAMTGPGAGSAAGVPVIPGGQTPLPSPAPGPDFNSEFKKYHGTSFDPNSSMDKGKMEQLRSLHQQHGKLSPSLVYNKQYGNKSPYIKSASVTAFAVLEGDMEKSANISKGLSAGLGWLGQRLGQSGSAAKSTAMRAAREAVVPTAPTGSGIDGGFHAARAATRAAKRQAAQAQKGVGRTRIGVGNSLAGAGDKIENSVGLQRALNYGVPAVGGAGLLYGSNRMGYGSGHRSGHRSGMSEGYDVGADAAMSAMPDSPGYFGGLLSAIAGRQPMDAAAMRNMLDQSKSDILQSILSGRA
jgi:hypothetical protein